MTFLLSKSKTAKIQKFLEVIQSLDRVINMYVVKGLSKFAAVVPEEKHSRLFLWYGKNSLKIITQKIAKFVLNISKDINKLFPESVASSGPAGKNEKTGVNFSIQELRKHIIILEALTVYFTFSLYFKDLKSMKDYPKDIEYLGFFVNSQIMTFLLSKSKTAKIQKFLEVIQSLDRVINMYVVKGLSKFAAVVPEEKHSRLFLWYGKNSLKIITQKIAKFVLNISKDINKLFPESVASSGPAGKNEKTGVNFSIQELRKHIIILEALTVYFTFSLYFKDQI